MRSAAFGLLALLSAGCSAFSLSGPAHLEGPTARAAGILRASASPPRFELDIPAEAITDVHVVGANLLVELMAETSSGLAACGPLVMLDGATGKVVWQRPRERACLGVVLRDKAIVVVENVAEKSRVTELDAATGGVLATAEGPVAQAAAGTETLFVLERSPGDGGKHVIVGYGPRLAVRSRSPVAFDEPIELTVVGDTAFAVAEGVLAVDGKTGRASAPVALGAQGTSASIAHATGLVVTRAPAKGPPSVFAFGLDGVARWRVEGRAALAVDASGVLVASPTDLALLPHVGAAARWSAKVGPLTGRPRLADGIVLVPQATELLALDAATGAVKWRAAAQPGEAKERVADEVHVAGGTVVWDTWRGVMGVDASGAVKYTIAVKSSPEAHREARARDAGIVPHLGREVYNLGASVKAVFDTRIGPHGRTLGNSSPRNALSAGTMEAAAQMSDAVNAYAQAMANIAQISLAGRRAESFSVAQRLAAASDAGEVLIRPIAWNVGRGFLLVRKADGAFAEVVTGPTDVYEAPYRSLSAAIFDGDRHVLLTVSEGFAPERIQPLERSPVVLAKRHLVGFAVDPAAFQPAATYAARSKVPNGSFLRPE